MNIPYFSSHLRCKEISEDPCEGGLNSAERVRRGGRGGGQWGKMGQSHGFSDISLCCWKKRMPQRLLENKINFNIVIKKIMFL